ncbi:unnamed protein product [Urochloa humidicola]
MEVLLSAAASDLVGRLISFLISKFQEPGSTDDVVRLQRALLRARVVVEEADARQVANQAMLLQLNQLRGEMWRGAYMLDSFTRRAVEPASRRSHATARRLVGRDVTGELSVVVETLEAALSDMKEFVVLLGACPHLNLQPYSSYLFLERCMFGRQMEKEQIMSFLLQPAAQDFGVLPVIGPHEVGKRTLVEHVCLDERVRDHFARIHRLSAEHLDDLQSHEHPGSSLDLTARSLIMVDLSDYSDGNIYEEVEERWRRLLSSLRHRVHRESKIIVISEAEKHSGLGTVPPIRLRAPRREELWYLFKALAFGGADPEERPDLVRIAMAVFKSIPDLTQFDVVNKLGAALRADLSARFWRRVLKITVGVTQLQLDAAPGGPRRLEDNTGYYYPRMPVMNGSARAPCLFYDRRKSTGMVRSELPKVTMLEVVQGVVPGEEKRFDVLVWQSRIPPYASYVATCDMERAAQVAEVGTKQIVNKRRRDQVVRESGEDEVRH